MHGPRRIAVLLAALLAVAAPSTAGAATTYTPPGVAGVGEYVEVVPSSGGDRPTGRGQSGGGGTSSGTEATGGGTSSGSSAGSGGTSSGTDGTGGGTSGADGSGAGASTGASSTGGAAIPARVADRIARSSRDAQATLGALGAAQAAPTALSEGASGEPSGGVSAVAAQLVGADGGPAGVVLPLFLVLSLAAFAVFTLRRRSS